MKELIEKLQKEANVTADQAEKVLGSVKSFIMEKFPMLESAVEKVFKGDNGDVPETEPSLLDKAEAKWDSLKDSAEKNWDKIEDKAGALTDDLKEKLAPHKDKIEEYLEKAKDSGEDVFDSVKSKIQEFLDKK